MIAKKLIYTKLNEIVAANLLNVSIYHQIVPQGKTFPAIVYSVISTNHEYCKGGAGQTQTRIQVDVWSKNDEQCATIAQKIKQGIDLFWGEFEGVQFQYTTWENEVESYDDDLDLHRITQDFMVRNT